MIRESSQKIFTIMQDKFKNVPVPIQIVLKELLKQFNLFEDKSQSQQKMVDTMVSKVELQMHQISTDNKQLALSSQYFQKSLLDQLSKLKAVCEEQITFLSIKFDQNITKNKDLIDQEMVKLKADFNSVLQNIQEISKSQAEQINQTENSYAKLSLLDDFKVQIETNLNLLEDKIYNVTSSKLSRTYDEKINRLFKIINDQQDPFSEINQNRKKQQIEVISLACNQVREECNTTFKNKIDDAVQKTLQMPEGFASQWKNDMEKKISAKLQEDLRMQTKLIVDEREQQDGVIKFISKAIDQHAQQIAALEKQLQSVLIDTQHQDSQVKEMQDNLYLLEKEIHQIKVKTQSSKAHSKRSCCSTPKSQPSDYTYLDLQYIHQQNNIDGERLNKQQRIDNGEDTLNDFSKLIIDNQQIAVRKNSRANCQNKIFNTFYRSVPLKNAEANREDSQAINHMSQKIKKYESSNQNFPLGSSMDMQSSKVNLLLENNKKNLSQSVDQQSRIFQLQNQNSNMIQRYLNSQNEVTKNNHTFKDKSTDIIDISKSRRPKSINQLRPKTQQNKRVKESYNQLMKTQPDAPIEKADMNFRHVNELDNQTIQQYGYSSTLMGLNSVTKDLLINQRSQKIRQQKKQTKKNRQETNQTKPGSSYIFQQQTLFNNANHNSNDDINTQKSNINQIRMLNNTIDYNKDIYDKYQSLDVNIL